MVKSSSNCIHTLTLAALLIGLKNTSDIMDKAEKHATANSIPLESLSQSRLFPDMFNLLQQLQ